jgi:thioredoxin reductase (NADPH)
VEVTNKVTKATQVIPVSALFVAIGQMPDNGAFSNLVDLDPKGYIEAGENCRTKDDGIFTAGDCRTKNVRQLTTAAADGAVAALAACSYIG